MNRLSFPGILIWLIHWELSRIRSFTPTSTLVAVLAVARDCPRTWAALQMEVLALRHQLNVLQHSVKRPKLTAADRFLWARLSRFWNGWRSALVMVKPETVIAWHRKGFRLFLDLEGTPQPAGTTACLPGNPETDSPDEPRESALGRIASG
jgi:hypothetical protein